MISNLTHPKQKIVVVDNIRFSSVASDRNFAFAPWTVYRSEKKTECVPGIAVSVRSLFSH